MICPRNREYIEPLNSQSFYDSSYFYTLLDNNIWSKAFAQAVQDTACAASGAVDRGIASANFVVLRETNMAAVLVETGFMTNVEELTRLCDETYQQKLMEGVARGVGDYLNSLPRK